MCTRVYIMPQVYVMYQTMYLVYLCLLADNTSRFPRIWRDLGPPCQHDGESQGRRLFGIQIRPQSAQVVRFNPKAQYTNHISIRRRMDIQHHSQFQL